MGKKAKVGKQRKDKFYHLAKETGYRSRAAFKLIQLNRKFEFLQKSRVLVDLCAAPGGWMQVAVQHMPVSSIVIGVDLFPIKPVAGTIAIQEDITSPRCLQLLKKELKTWKADVVLNDGAGNVGQNWIHDAYTQTCLALSAFKVATELLKPGGYFITKIFRSKDYNALIWVLQQFFKNVYSTKPAASRIESAEIFVVCKGYLAPNQIDPKFLDPKHVFEEIAVPEGKKQLQQLLMEVGKKKKAEGYPTGETLLYRPVNASEFLRSSDHIEMLGNTSQIILDEDWIAKNSKTTQDIKDYCSDIKVLGRKEIKALVTWRKDLRDKLEQFAKLKGEVKDEELKVEEVEAVEDEEEDTETKLEEAIASMKESELKDAKKKRKKLLKERRRVHEKTNLKMIIPGDAGPTDTSEDTLFSLKSVKTHQDVNDLTESAPMPDLQEPELDSDEELQLYKEKRRSRLVHFDKDEEILDSSGTYYKKMDSDGEDSGQESGSDEEDPNLDNGLGFDDDVEVDDEEEEFDIEDVAPIASHPLITDLDHSDKNQKRIRKAEMWFDKDAFKDLNDESDEDLELTKLAEAYERKGAHVIGFNKTNGESKDSKKNKSPKEDAKSLKRKIDKIENAVMKVVPAPDSKKKKKLKLDVEGLALGTLMVESAKSKRDLLEEGWNRYAFNDPGLPEWFVKDEKKHMRKDLPVPEALVEEYKKNMQEINARPIKKVVEAKARKKKRTIQKLEKAKKKAESILEKSELTESEKASQLKQLYKKARVTKKKEVTYVVAKKFNTSKRAKRPAGLKGHYKVVDPRMKKDLRKMKTNMGKQSKGGKGKGGSRGGKTGGKSSGGKSGGKGKGRGR